MTAGGMTDRLLALTNSVLGRFRGGLAMSNVATVGSAFAIAGSALLISTVAMLIGLGFLIWAGLKDGDPGANAYGPSPDETALIG